MDKRLGHTHMYNRVRLCDHITLPTIDVNINIHTVHKCIFIYVYTFDVQLYNMLCKLYVSNCQCTIQTSTYWFF